MATRILEPLLPMNSSSISEVIRQRLIKNSVRFNANDTIFNYITDAELKLLKLEITEKFQDLLNSLIIDTKNDHNTNETAKRIAKKYIDEIFKGRYTAPPKITEFPNFKNYEGIYTVGPISMRSTCSHHFAPIMGQVWIGIDPGSTVVGLSKFNRIVDWIMSRPQIQEEAIVTLADYIENSIKPKGLAVYVKAKHFCMCWRGVKDNDTLMNNLVLRGSLKNESTKTEFFNLISSDKPR